MYVALPYKSESSLNEFLGNLNSNTIKEILNETTTQYAVAIQLPKISFKWSKFINEELRKLGIDEVFTRHSNLSNMVNGTARISRFMHSADVQMNEYGLDITEPTTTTPEKPFSLMTLKYFYVDRPFFFFIYDHTTESVLFYSAVFNPSQH